MCGDSKMKILDVVKTKIDEGDVCVKKKPDDIGPSKSMAALN